MVFLYDSHNREVFLKDKGANSDLTFLLRKNHKIIIVSTSKNNNTEHIGGYDIRDISDLYHQKYKTYEELRYCLCTRNSKVTRELISKSELANKDIRDKLEHLSTIYVDWNDLQEAFYNFNLFINRYTYLI